MKKRVLTVLSLFLTLCLLMFTFSACEPNIPGDNDGVFKFSDDFTINGRNVAIQVESDVEFLDFNDKITVSGNVSYQVYDDLSCTVEISSKEVALSYGDNLYFILATVNNEETLYHVTINRKGSNSGSLDVSFAYKKNITNNWAEVEGDIYAGEIWEPGKTVVRYFRIRNEGVLNFKYKLEIRSNITSGIDLANVVDVYVVDVADDGMQSVSISDYVSENYKGTINNPVDNYIFEGVLEWGDHNIVAVVLKMQTTAGNEYQSGKFDVGVSVVATLIEEEEDSFGPGYDVDVE